MSIPEDPFREFRGPRAGPEARSRMLEAARHALLGGAGRTPRPGSGPILGLRIRTAAGERTVLALRNRMPVVVLRPPAVYGPGDREALRVLQMAARGFILVPAVAGARLSLVHVDDAATAVLTALTLPDLPDRPIEFDDHADRGYGWDQIAAAAAAALGRPVRTIALPHIALYASGAVGTLVSRLTRRPSVLSWDKVGEVLHPDWVAASQRLPGYLPRWSLPEGFKNTAEWADSQGLLRLQRSS